MSLVRMLVLAALVTAAVVLQVVAFGYLSYDGVVPNLALLLVVAAALVRGPDFAAVLGFFGGLAIDLAPPADHVAGRWALAFVVVGYLAGLARRDARASAVAAVLVVAAGSFIGTSLFALSGLVLQDSGVTFEGVMHVLPIALLYDIVLTPLVVPAVLAMMRRLEPASVRL
jgi:rod shape-determining protein MreD